MTINSNYSQEDEFVEVQCHDRWSVYHRLQQLDIACHCAAYQPLKAQITSVDAAIQIWSVVQQATQSRRHLALWLERCWTLCLPSDA